MRSEDLVPGTVLKSTHKAHKAPGGWRDSYLQCRKKPDEDDGTGWWTDKANRIGWGDRQLNYLLDEDIYEIVLPKPQPEEIALAVAELGRILET